MSHDVQECGITPIKECCCHSIYFFFFFLVTRLSLQRSADDGLGLVSHANGMREVGSNMQQIRGGWGGWKQNRTALTTEPKDEEKIGVAE